MSVHEILQGRELGYKENLPGVKGVSYTHSGGTYIESNKVFMRPLHDDKFEVFVDHFRQTGQKRGTSKEISFTFTREQILHLLSVVDEQNPADHKSPHRLPF